MSTDLKIAMLNKAKAERDVLNAKIARLALEAYPVNAIVEWDYIHPHGTTTARGRITMHGYNNSYVYVKNQETGKTRGVFIENLRVIERPA